jgi:hypothetical protein
MMDWPVSEEERNSTMVTQRERQLWQAQEAVRSAGEALRRAIRAEKDADREFRAAERRRDRIRVPAHGASRPEHPPRLQAASACEPEDRSA